MLRDLPSMSARCWDMERRQRLGGVSSLSFQPQSCNVLPAMMRPPKTEDWSIVDRRRKKKESDSGRLRIARNRFMLDERLDC
jgi:hypothetical protein